MCFFIEVTTVFTYLQTSEKNFLAEPVILVFYCRRKKQTDYFGESGCLNLRVFGVGHISKEHVDCQKVRAKKMKFLGLVFSLLLLKLNRRHPFNNGSLSHSLSIFDSHCSAYL